MEVDTISEELRNQESPQKAKRKLKISRRIRYQVSSAGQAISPLILNQYISAYCTEESFFRLISAVQRIQLSRYPFMYTLTLV